MKKYTADFVKGVLAVLDEKSLPFSVEGSLRPLGLLSPELLSFINIGIREDGWTLDSIISFLSCDERMNSEPVVVIEAIRSMSKLLGVEIVTDEVPGEEVASEEVPQEGISKTALYLQGKEEYREAAEEEIWNYCWGGKDKKGEQHSALATANHLGILSSNLSKLMKEFGIPKRTRREAQILQHKKQGHRGRVKQPEKKGRRKSGKVSPEEWERRKKQVNKLYWDQGLNTEKTAKKLGISLSTLNYWMNKCEIRRHSPVEKRKLARKKKAGDAVEGQ